MTVAFDYWGTSEILLRLSREEHRGRTLFWFNQNLFTSSWFRERLDITLANAGPRYSAILNVELPIAQVVDGFCRALFGHLIQLDARRDGHSRHQRSPESKQRMD